MAKLTTNDISVSGGLSAAITATNVNNALIEVAMEKTLSRDGTTPNEMEASLDMNDNRILNLPEPANSTEPLRLGDLSAFTESGIFLQAGTGAAERTIQEYLREQAIRVTDFGGTCDGVEDDTAAFALAKATGKPIYIPAGHIVNINAATWTAGLVIFGDGPESQIKWQNTTGSSSLFLFNTNVMDVIFRDLTIDGNRQAHTDTSSYFAAIDFQASATSSLTLLNVRFPNGRIMDVRVKGPTTGTDLVNFHMENCEFTDGLVGTDLRAAQCVNHLDGVDARWINNRASLPTKPNTYGRAGFNFDGQNRNGTDLQGKLIAYGNRFNNIGRGTADTLGCVDVYYGANDVVIYGNTADQVCGRFITIKSGTSRAVIYGNSVLDCYSSVANVATAYVMFQDLYDSESDKHIIFANNVCGTSDGYGLFVDGAGLSSTNSSNIVLTNFTAGACDVAGIHIRSTGSISIVNPMIDGGLSAITFSGLTGPLSINGGILANTTSHTVEGSAGVAALTSCDFSLMGTKIRNSGSRGISLTAVRSYDIDCDIDTAVIGITTTGSTVHSRIRGKMVACTTTWSKAAADTLVDWQVESSTSLPFATRSRTIATGVIDIYSNWHYVDTEASAASDDLDTINGGVEGQILVLRAASSSRDVVIKDGTGNINTAGDFTLTNANDTITLQKISTNWHEISRSDNTA